MSRIASFRNLTRMSHWLLLSIVAYALASVMAQMIGYGESGLWPRIQIVLWKIGHLNLAAFLGYWLDRNCFRDRVTATTAPTVQLRRAIIIAATMLAFGMAL